MLARPPPPPKELDVHTLSVLEGHDNYVDVAGWCPTHDNVITASTDRSVRSVKKVNWFIVWLLLGTNCKHNKTQKYRSWFYF